jgi:serine protease Do
LNEKEPLRVAAVEKGSIAAAAGVAPGDRLRTLGGRPLASLADVQFALDRAPREGATGLEAGRGGERRTATLNLPAGWKEKTDISWRWSLKSLPPEPPVAGDDLDPEQRAALRLGNSSLALRQGPFLSEAARRAGVQIGDVIIAVEGESRKMSGREFDAWFRLRFQGEKEVRLRLRRGKEEREALVPLLR